MKTPELFQTKKIHVQHAPILPIPTISPISPISPISTISTISTGPFNLDPAMHIFLFCHTEREREVYFPSDGV